MVFNIYIYTYFELNYKISNVKGNFAVVHECFRKSDNERFAVKVLS